MKKYIRTPNGIYETWKVIRWGYNFVFDTKIKEADTIEELCDEIVIKDNLLNENAILLMKEKINSFNDVHCITIYGAIWIEIKLQDGKSVYKLEPVAILDEDGKLELI